MIHLHLRCVPPSVTAQQKRLTFATGKPRFFKPARLETEETTWWALLTPHVPPTPLEGPVSLFVRLAYPHRKTTAKKRLDHWIPKTSKPDAGNAAKAIEDMLVKLRFLGDDSQVVKLTIEKYYAPESNVGITIHLEPFTV